MAAQSGSAETLSADGSLRDPNPPARSTCSRNGLGRQSQTCFGFRRNPATRLVPVATICNHLLMLVSPVDSPMRCPGPVRRREFLRAALAGFAGLSLPGLLRLRAEAAADETRERTAVIIVWL